MRLLLICLAFLLISPAFSQSSNPKYEFRAVWIATVDNIDWPQRGVTDPELQKADFIRQLDQHKKNGMNAMIVQVRPAADAFYPSPYEPWSQWLTGVQGKAPSPYWDPLAFMIDETHKRGMEFHAWLNPYRANFNIKTASIAPNHITRVHPEWFLTYGDKKYFDPSNKDAQKFVIDVVRDLVKRYPIDGVHMDDYFYPYRIPGKEFPDDDAYSRSGSNLSKGDWRRSNVDSIIQKLSVVIKEEKPYCKFGISPFSVWRNIDMDPEGSDSKAGQTNYDDLYADILLWLKEGWVDYVAPQLYLEIGHEKIAYEKLLDWWSKHSYGRHVYIGHAIYRAMEKSPAWHNPNELPNQIKLLRQYPNTVQGSIYFSSTSFDPNPNGWNDSLRNNYYSTPALVPPMPWITEKNPDGPDSLKISYYQGSPSRPIYSLTAYKKKEVTDIRSMLLYISSNRQDIMDRNAAALKFIISRNKKDNSIAFYGFSPSMYCKTSKRYFVASSFESNCGGESGISNIITVIKKKDGSYRFQ